MAKTQIYQQEEALSVYFRDMLADPRSVADKPAPEAESPAPEPEPQSTQAGTRSVQREVKATPQTDPAPVTTIYKLLLCQIGGMKLALDVSALNNIVHWPSSGLNQLPGHRDWQLGLFRDREQHIEVVDIRHLLQAEKRNGEQPGYILLVNGRRMGVACDGISQIINIDDNHINWRSETSQRPWFSGVIADSMHSIIDLPALLTALEQGEMA
jgi:chemotaxis signal transduction protein